MITPPCQHVSLGLFQFLHDDLLTDSICQIVRSFIDAGTDIISTKAKLIKTPILYAHGDADPINSYQGTAKAYELTPSSDKELKKWTGLFHECKLLRKEPSVTNHLSFIFTLQYTTKLCLKDIKFANITSNGLNNVVLLLRIKSTYLSSCTIIE